MEGETLYWGKNVRTDRQENTGLEERGERGVRGGERPQGGVKMCGSSTCAQEFFFKTHCKSEELLTWMDV